MIAANDEFLSPKIDEPRLFTIEQVSAQTGLTKRTLRYYEEVGLLPPTDRTEGNYRRYTEADVKRLDKIKKLRDLLGFSLEESLCTGVATSGYYVRTAESPTAAQLAETVQLVERAGGCALALPGDVSAPARWCMW